MLAGAKIPATLTNTMTTHRMSATDSNNTKGATANAVASIDMVWPKWTHDTPTESGYYWWQHDPKCVTFVVEVRPFVDGTKEALFPWGNMILLDRKSTARWAGPIPLPRCHTVPAQSQPQHQN